VYVDVDHAAGQRHRWRADEEQFIAGLDTLYRDTAVYDK
jgi:hypothetical protein